VSPHAHKPADDHPASRSKNHPTPTSPPLRPSAPAPLPSLSANAHQVWVVFRRYREFVTLRQRLKAACQQQHHRPPASPPGLTDKPRSQAKRPSGSGGLALGTAGGNGGGGGGSGGGGVGAVRPSPALIASVQKILSECRFPSKLALGRSFSLKQERRKALHSFVAALVSYSVKRRSSKISGDLSSCEGVNGGARAVRC